MAFKSRELSVLAYANGFTLWHYRTTDSCEAMVGAPGYFDSACELLRAGDRVMVGLAQPPGAAIIDLVVASGRLLKPTSRSMPTGRNRSPARSRSWLPYSTSPCCLAARSHHDVATDLLIEVVASEGLFWRAKAPIRGEAPMPSLKFRG